MGVSWRGGAPVHSALPDEKQTMQVPQVIDPYRSGHLGFFEEAFRLPTSRAFVERFLYGFADWRQFSRSGGSSAALRPYLSAYGGAPTSALTFVLK
jgi:hypothetical protein